MDSLRFLCLLFKNVETPECFKGSPECFKKTLECRRESPE